MPPKIVLMAATLNGRQIPISVPGHPNQAPNYHIIRETHLVNHAQGNDAAIIMPTKDMRTDDQESIPHQDLWLQLSGGIGGPMDAYNMNAAQPMNAGPAVIAALTAIWRVRMQVPGRARVTQGGANVNHRLVLMVHIPVWQPGREAELRQTILRALSRAMDTPATAAAAFAGPTPWLYRPTSVVFSMVGYTGPLGYGDATAAECILSAVTFWFNNTTARGTQRRAQIRDVIFLVPRRGGHRSIEAALRRAFTRYVLARPAGTVYNPPLLTQPGFANNMAVTGAPAPGGILSTDPVLQPQAVFRQGRNWRVKLQ